MPDTFLIDSEVVEKIFDQAGSEAPREACGMLGGRGMAATAAYPAENVDASNLTYRIEPGQAFQIIREMREAEVDFIACYHSHPETEAYPSPTDRAQAGDSDLVYVIASLRDPEKREIRAFKIQNELVSELGVSIVDER